MRSLKNNRGGAETFVVVCLIFLPMTKLLLAYLGIFLYDAQMDKVNNIVKEAVEYSCIEGDYTNQTMTYIKTELSKHDTFNITYWVRPNTSNQIGAAVEITETQALNRNFSQGEIFGISVVGQNSQLFGKVYNSADKLQLFGEAEGMMEK